MSTLWSLLWSLCAAVEHGNKCVTMPSDDLTSLVVRRGGKVAAAAPNLISALAEESQSAVATPGLHNNNLQLAPAAAATSFLSPPAGHQSALGQSVVTPMLPMDWKAAKALTQNLFISRFHACTCNNNNCKKSGTCPECSLCQRKFCCFLCCNSNIFSAPGFERCEFSKRNR